MIHADPFLFWIGYKDKYALYHIVALSVDVYWDHDFHMEGFCFRGISVYM